MKDRPPLSKVQLALLRSIDAASRMIGTPGIVPVDLPERIAWHYFRQDRAFGAIYELRRSGNLIPLVRDQFRVVVAPPSWEDGLLPGPVAEPLEHDALAAIVAEKGYPTNGEMGGCTATLTRRKGSVRKSAHWDGRFVLLANHLVGEEWYGGPLPEMLSGCVMASSHLDDAFVRELRTELSLAHLIRSVRVPGKRNQFHWGATPFAIESVKTRRANPTLTRERIATIAHPLGFHPLPRGDQLGR